MRIPEIYLDGVIRVASSDEVDEAEAAPMANGAAHVASAAPRAPTPSEVQQLAQLVADELPYKPPSEARRSNITGFPGVSFSGDPAGASLGAPQPLRIPTVFAPFRAGIIFSIDGREIPPGVTLNFANTTLLLPNATYDGIHSSGMMDFFEFGNAAQICFIDSVLVLESCEGFPANTYHVWCCMVHQCNLLYTQQAIEDIGYTFPGKLNYIQCHAVRDADVDAAARAEPGAGARPRVRGPLAATIAAGVVLMLLTALTGIIVCVRRRTQQSDEKPEVAWKNGSEESLKVSSRVLAYQAMSLHSASTSTRAQGSAIASSDGGQGSMKRPPSAQVRTQTSGVTTSVGVTTDMYDTAAAAAEQTTTQQKARLAAELDHMRHRGESFLGQFVVLPATERREGGQGVVQFMRRARTEEAVAVKFFLSRRAFETEVQLYRVDVLRSMMPALFLEVGNSDGAERNGRGYPWPPCMVLEKGESLQEWKAKTQPAFSTILDALCLIAERLAQLHGSGWAHRDLKPGNVLRLPGQHSWTLMDFGCAALTGLSVPLTFSPSYAPPEVAHAVERGAKTIVADAAADMWAFGVMAFELLTGAPLFPPFTSREAIWAQLCGREALPWEAGAPGQAGKLAQLRVLKGTILQCLQRRPEDRPTAEEVVRPLRKLFDPHSITSTRPPQPASAASMIVPPALLEL